MEPIARHPGNLNPEAHGFRVGGVLVAAVVVGIALWIGLIWGGIAIYHALAH